MQSEADDITVGDPPPHLMDEDLGSGQKWPQDSVALCVNPGWASGAVCGEAGAGDGGSR